MNRTLARINLVPIAGAALMAVAMALPWTPAALGIQLGILPLGALVFGLVAAALAVFLGMDPARIPTGWVLVGLAGALAVGCILLSISFDVMGGGKFAVDRLGLGVWTTLIGCALLIGSAFQLLRAHDLAAGREPPQGLRAAAGWYAQRHRSLVVVLGMAFVTALLPLLVLIPPFNAMLPQNPWLGAFSSAGVFVLLALGLNIVVGLAGLLDLGYAAFFAIGAYTYAYGASPFSGNEFPFVLMIVVAALVAATFGLLLGAPTLRLRGDYLAIVTLGFGEIVPIVFRNAEEYTNGTNGIGGLYKPEFAGYEFGLLNPWPFYVLMAVILTLTLVLIYRLEGSRLGRAWMAIREDELAAASNGINTVTTKLLAFALGASTAGFAGVFNAAKLTVVDPDQFLFTVSFTVLAMVVLGGMGNIWGVAVGAFVIAIIQSVVLTQMNTFMENLGIPILKDIDFVQYQFLLYGLALVFMMLLRPEGLFPSRRRKEELHVAEDPSIGGEGLDAEVTGAMGEPPR
ncbi:MAG: branched-chain amino acid ABC transporter permease [Chloroflexi bacterium]|nr:branched-chain amino acid ABC transporter permease [Chloroflexota bacterium]